MKRLSFRRYAFDSGYQPLATLSETDRARAMLGKHAHQIMSRTLVTIATDTIVEAATQLLLEHRVSCLRVVTAKGHLEGIVTWRSFLREYLRHKT